MKLKKRMTYIVTGGRKRYSEFDLTGLDRTERIALFTEENRKLGDHIKERFPDIEIVHVGAISVAIQMPEDVAKERAKEIEEAFNCVLMDAETPTELIRPVKNLHSS